MIITTNVSIVGISSMSSMTSSLLDSIHSDTLG